MVERLRASGGALSPERLVLAGILALAAALRFADLATRGTWDADQGHDMLVLLRLVRNGEIPLLGPPTSIGDFHHGVLYYYLLAPAAALGGADPLAVVAAIAGAGVAAVAVTWWLARAIGGPVAGGVAGLLMAVSASAIEESTFIWNPNLVALTSAVALAAAWRAWTTGRAAWWVVAAGAVTATMHCHVLGSALLLPIGGLLAADLRRRRGRERARLARAAGLGILLLAASYVPLAVHELGHDFAESRAALAFVAGGGGPDGEEAVPGIPVRLAVVGLRVLSWPLAGLLPDSPLAALLATVLVVAAIAFPALAPAGSPLGRLVRPAERTASRWLAASLAWTIAALGLAARGLATVVPGLPNDHYHAFADPMVFVAVGLGIAVLARWRPGGRRAGAATAVVAVALVVAFNTARWPPAVAADGGWPTGRAAGDRVLAALGRSPAGGPAVVHSLPGFKSPDALVFALERAAPGSWVTPDGDDGVDWNGRAHVVLCDGLFAASIGSPCGGPAEDRLLASHGLVLADRFEAAPGRWVSVYRPG